MNLKHLAKIWAFFKKYFGRLPGGFRNPANYFLLLVLWWGIMAFLRERGWYPKKSLQGKHIFITGAGSGLGRRMAIQFALLGAKVTVSGIDLAPVVETKKIIEETVQKRLKKQPEIFALKLDVSSREAVTNGAQEAKTALGDVDVLINNAGIVQGKSFMDMNEFMIRKTLQVNVECHFWLIREFLPAMIKKNDGHIVSISSVAGMAGSPEMTDYCASKFGALGLMEALRVELKRERINVKTTSICPYFINTGMFDGVRCSLIYPLQEQDDVVWRIVNGIRQDEEHVVIPWSISMIAPLASMCPVYFKDFLSWAFVGWTAMAQFRGRQQEIAQENERKATEAKARA